MMETIPPDAGLPSRQAFAAAIGVSDPAVIGLLRVLIARCGMAAEADRAGNRDAPALAECLLAVEQLGRFVFRGPSVPDMPEVISLGGATLASKHHHQLYRFELLVRALEAFPSAAERVRACVQTILRQTTALTLFAEIGLPNDRGLIAETADRMARRWLPQPPDERNLAALCFRITSRADFDLEATAPYLGPMLWRLCNALGLGTEPSADARDAIALIATRIAALGLAEGVRARSPQRSAQGGIADSPFLLLARAPLDEIPGLLTACRAHIEHIHVALEDSGVSVDLVYSLDTIERGLRRIEALWPFAAQRARADGGDLARLFGQLMGGLAGERSFRSLLADNFRLLARKVIERAGHTGEHYVTSTRAEYWKMIASAAGGGMLTAGTAITKFLIKWGHMPLFIDGLASALLFALSFIAIQLCGFTLATKQPSMTAAALAGTLRASSGEARTQGLVELIARISRSQFAAAIGNVSVAVVVALGFDAAYRYHTGDSFLGGGSAQATMSSFHPWRSGTIPFAAMTGGLLWCSSLFAGWFENALVFRRIPEAIAHHPLGRRVGAARMQRVARFVERQAAGFGGSVSLGVFLGMTPAFAKFVGLPLDVRHVTLSSGSLALAASSLGVEALTWANFGAACVGIACIGLLNFGVSFTLALLVALRARDVPRGEWASLPGAVLRYAMRYPLRFFYPPRKGRETTRHLTDTNHLA